MAAFLAGLLLGGAAGGASFFLGGVVVAIRLKKVLLVITFSLVRLWLRSFLPFLWVAGGAAAAEDDATVAVAAVD